VRFGVGPLVPLHLEGAAVKAFGAGMLVRCRVLLESCVRFGVLQVA